ncbi:dTMP kinase [Miltoncostaea oceani]|uniref:dTMP kinase n=1 Tax=Miltoncostaea oceani TaxID=2843216 RepID=UPI001C3D0819|nr:dTMP kinase [Miltoncostaea oceani]
MLITFEGSDGAGKSTQVALLAEHLEDRGVSCLKLREPGGTRVGEQIRALLIDPDLTLDPLTELMLFSAARAELVSNVITPALALGQVVILDRFIHSTIAYQGYGRALGHDVAAEACRLATSGLEPDLTVLLDISEQERTARIGISGRDRIESSGIEFYARVREAYLRLASTDPDRFLVLDATSSPRAIAAAVSARVDELRDATTR